MDVPDGATVLNPDPTLYAVPTDKRLDALAVLGSVAYKVPAAVPASSIAIFTFTKHSLPITLYLPTSFTSTNAPMLLVTTGV